MYDTLSSKSFLHISQCKISNYKSHTFTISGVGDAGDNCGVPLAVRGGGPERGDRRLSTLQKGMDLKNFPLPCCTKSFKSETCTFELIPRALYSSIS